MHNRALSLWLLLLTTLVLSACARLPEHLQRSAEKVPSALSSAESQIKVASDTYKAMQNEDTWDFLDPYAEREHWGDADLAARRRLMQAHSVYEGTVEALIKENTPEGAVRMRQALGQIDTLIREALAEARRPLNRGKFLLEIRAQAPRIYQSARSHMQEVDELSQILHDRLSELMKTYPDKVPDLTKRWNAAKARQMTANGLFTEIQTEFDKINDGDPDYAKLGDSASTLTAIVEDAKTYANITHQKVDELDQTIVKILSDQKIDYYFIVGRASWCESDSCGSGTNYSYPPVKITEGVLEDLNKFRGDNLAQMRRKLFSSPEMKIHVPRNLWGALKIDPRQSMARGHDHADYWYEEAYAKAYHRYTNIVDGEETLTNWEAVSEDTFWKHQEHLGMALVSKPVGLYSEEALTDPEPSGAALIAEPTMADGEPTGRNHYGYWGGGFWHWYGQYRFFGDILGRRYGYNDWTSYRNRGRGAYYGRNNQWGTYGSQTYRNSRYTESAYAKRNPAAIANARASSGNIARTSRLDPSVRGAGSSARNKGPGGRGK